MEKQYLFLEYGSAYWGTLLELAVNNFMLEVYEVTNDDHKCWRYSIKCIEQPISYSNELTYDDVLQYILSGFIDTTKRLYPYITWYEKI